MIRFSLKQIKELIKYGAAIDVTCANDRNIIPKNYIQIGYFKGTYGANGQVFMGIETHKLYATTNYNYRF